MERGPASQLAQYARARCRTVGLPAATCGSRFGQPAATARNEARIFPIAVESNQRASAVELRKYIARHPRPKIEERAVRIPREEVHSIVQSRCVLVLRTGQSAKSPAFSRYQSLGVLMVPRKGLGLDPSNYSKNSHLPLRRVRCLYHWAVLVSTLLCSPNHTHCRGSETAPGRVVWDKFGMTTLSSLRPNGLRARHPSGARRSSRNPRHRSRPTP